MLLHLTGCSVWYLLFTPTRPHSYARLLEPGAVRLLVVIRPQGRSFVQAWSVLDRAWGPVQQAYGLAATAVSTILRPRSQPGLVGLAHQGCASQPLCIGTPVPAGLHGVSCRSAPSKAVLLHSPYRLLTAEGQAALTGYPQRALCWYLDDMHVSSKDPGLGRLDACTLDAQAAGGRWPGTAALGCRL